MAKPLPCPRTCNVLLVGGGGREHALAWKLRQSQRLGRLWLTNPENAGMASLGEACDCPLEYRNFFRMARWCDGHDIHLVVVGPEAPLAAGIADALAAPGRLVFGPTRDGANLEADKAFAKDLMRSASVPTAEGRAFRDLESAVAYLESRTEGMVVKASGLAAGKGVVVCASPREGVEAAHRIMGDREFGDAGTTLVVEERLKGQEVSVLALTDGRTIWMLDPCQDHKQVGEGDTGPNTGGMGAYCPTPLLDEPMTSRIEREILVPIVDALRRDGIVYRGVLYAGLMLTHAGPKVLEFNCRFGDPECQPLMARLRGDLVEILWATAAGSLDDVTLSFDPRTACTVVVCAGGYPGPYEKGNTISGLDEAGRVPGVTVFHAGTRRETDGRIVTNGGRVVSVTALADSLRAARDLATEAAGLIRFDGAFFRRDIGFRVL
jgi:phosphoribosylamine--glycine ligase